MDIREYPDSKDPVKSIEEWIRLLNAANFLNIQGEKSYDLFGLAFSKYNNYAREIGSELIVVRNYKVNEMIINNLNGRNTPTLNDLIEAYRELLLDYERLNSTTNASL